MALRFILTIFFTLLDRNVSYILLDSQLINVPSHLNFEITHEWLLCEKTGKTKTLFLLLVFAPKYLPLILNINT